LVGMREREKILLEGTTKNEPAKLVHSKCLLTEPTPS